MCVIFIAMKKQQIAVIAKTINFELLDVMMDAFKVPFSIITPNPAEMENRNVRVIYDNDLINRRDFFQKISHPRPFFAKKFSSMMPKPISSNHPPAPQKG